MKGKHTDDQINQFLNQMKNGDSEALASLYDRTCRSLYALCYSYFHNQYDSEDAMSDSYLKIQQEIARFNGENGYAWISTITRNICLNRLKRESRVVAVDFTDEAVVNAHGIPETDENTATDDGDIVSVAKTVLGETEFRILIQHAVAERKFKDIAAELGKLESTVRWQYHQALKKVRCAYKERRA